MQIDMYLVQHVQHAVPVIHTVMAAVSAVHIVIHWKQTLVPNWHAVHHRAVHRQRVGHVHRERATGVIINLQPIHRAHQRTALNLWHL